MIVNKYTCRTFSVTDQDRILATVSYANYFSSSAEVTIGASNAVIKRVNFGGTKFSVLRNGTREVGKIRLGTKSELQFLDPLNGKVVETYEIIRKGIFSGRYEIRSEQNNVIAKLIAKRGWFKFYNDMFVEYRDETIDLELFTKLMTYTAFVAHHHYRQANMG